MSERISQTAFGDAPLSAAYKPDPSTIQEDAGQDDVLIGRTVTINKPAAELYSFWSDLANLPRIMPEVVSVNVFANGNARWTIQSGKNKRVEWDSETVEDRPNECIAWRSIKEDVGQHGRVEFRTAPAGRGTEVAITLTHPDPGLVASAINKLTQQDPNIQARRALRRFKQLMETGEISTTTPPAAAPRG